LIFKKFQKIKKHGKEFPVGFWDGFWVVTATTLTITASVLIDKSIVEGIFQGVKYNDYMLYCGLCGYPIQTKEVFINSLRELGLEYYPYSFCDLIWINKKILRLLEIKENGTLSEVPDVIGSTFCSDVLVVVRQLSIEDLEFLIDTCTTIAIIYWFHFILK